MTIERLPTERNSVTRKLKIKYTDDHGQPQVLKIYVLVGLYEDHRIGEIFIRGDKVGSFMAGALDAFAMVFSVGLQHGVPLQMLTAKLRHSKFPPSGFTGDPEFRSCSSPFDLIAQWLDAKFPEGKLRDDRQGRVDPTADVGRDPDQKILTDDQTNKVS